MSDSSLHNTLNQLAEGDSAWITDIDVSEELGRRLTALGLSIGKQVRVLRRAAFNGLKENTLPINDAVTFAIEPSSNKIIS
jgi:hypothetical protein